MYKILNAVLVFLIVSFVSSAQDIKSPSEFLGYELGTEFSRHHEVISYFEHVSNTIPTRVKLQNYGYTHERRGLYIAIISSEENIRNLNNIRKNNLKQIGLESNGSTYKDVAIVWLSYNVHGNESSSSEASMQTIYELITTKQEWLENTVVIIDPCLNPDGRDRYVNWYNSNANKPFNTSQLANEHNEPWPSGRPNHYLFDLNRDWAWLTQIESRQRIKIYNQWMPHIHVDFHEQGINDHYYFAPAAEPYHKIVSDWQQAFQVVIGKNHAKYFDRDGVLYFTKERFDLFYPGYGDTYPMFNGAIGMTYEQAGHGRAGLGIVNNEGELLTLKDRINRHTIAGLSTVEVASKHAAQLNEKFVEFYKYKDLHYKSFVLQGQQNKIEDLKRLLDQHQIQYANVNSKSVSGFKYSEAKIGSLNTTQNDIAVSTNQPKGRFVSALFEPNSKLPDSLTYDITAWSLPYAYGLEAIASTKEVATKIVLSDKLKSSADYDCVAYLFSWNHITDAKLLGSLLKNNIKVRYTSKDIVTDQPNRTFKKGSLIVTRGDNTHIENFDKLIVGTANDNKKFAIPVKSGFSQNGPDFGSQYVTLINPPEIAVLMGDGTSYLSYGSIWHFFEQQLNYPFTALNTKNLNSVDLLKFDVLIMPSGYYKRVVNSTVLQKITNWVEEGGKVIAIDRALNTFVGKEGFELMRKTSKPESKDLNIPYEDRNRQYVKQLITGAIFKTKVDNTHPLAFGYEKNYFTLKLNATSYGTLKKGFTVAYIDKDTIPVSGFAGSKTQTQLKSSMIIGEERKGKGSFVYIVDDVLYRSFWENGKLFFANAVFLLNNKAYID